MLNTSTYAGARLPTAEHHMREGGSGRHHALRGPISTSSGNQRQFHFVLCEAPDTGVPSPVSQPRLTDKHAVLA